MEQATDAEKAMAVSEFLDFKRRNKVFSFRMVMTSELLSAVSVIPLLSIRLGEPLRFGLSLRNYLSCLSSICYH